MMFYNISTIEKILVTLTVVLLITLAWVYNSRLKKETKEVEREQVIKEETIVIGKQTSETSHQSEVYEDKTNLISISKETDKLPEKCDEPTIPNFHNFTRDLGDSPIKEWPLGGGCPMSAMFSGKYDRDPKEFCDHIQSEVKKAEQNVTNQEINKKLTDDQIAEEKKTQHAQVEAIYRLMSQDGDRFGMDTVNDMHDQMKLYM